jgi:hypothetical protein
VSGVIHADTAFQNISSGSAGGNRLITSLLRAAAVLEVAGAMIEE